VYLTRNTDHSSDLSSGETLLTLLRNGDADALLTGQGDQRLFATANHEDIGQTSGEGGAGRILDVDNVKGTRVAIAGLNDANATSVTTASDHAQVASLELDVLGDGTGLNVKDDGVVDLDVGRWVADGARVVGDDEWNTLLGNADLGDLAQLVACLLGGDAVDGEAALDVIDETEGLVRLVNGDDVHETGGEGGVAADFTVNLDEILLQDGLDLLTIQGVMQTITQEDDQRQTLALLVRALGWLRGEDTGQFVQHPVGWGIETLQVLLLTTSHFWLKLSRIRSVRQSKSDSKMG